MNWLRMLCLFAAVASLLAVAGEPKPSGPAAEKRFPPLRLPAGFTATLFACDPMIEYPSVIAAGPRAGSLFVGIDYMTGLGERIERSSDVRLLEDTDGDGYADRSTVFATGFNSIQGLAYHDGTVFVMHAPHLTALRDTKSTGKAGERRDLFTGLGQGPDQDSIRLHNANGVVASHDGWLYLALGDHGCDVKRPEGDRLVLEGGGILRCRADGRDLHVFATGLRNIYDVALDEDLNVFVRDNENDGGDYKIRVCHSFFGADHGYPYLYRERPDEALAPLADLGLGSSAGGACYLEKQFPAEYRGNLFFCEWGRALMRYPLRRAGATFASSKEVEFAAGAANDPYGFKPTDVVVDRDGALFISDWADGQRPRRGRGRIYRVSFGETGEKRGQKSEVRSQQIADLVRRLDSESYWARCVVQAEIERRGPEALTSVDEALAKSSLGVRGRLHAVWIIAKSGNSDNPNARERSVNRLVRVLKKDSEPRVQAQAVRALGDLCDPILIRHRLNSGPGDAALAARVVELSANRDPRVRLEVLVLLGRLRWPEAPNVIRRLLTDSDPALAHAAQWALRRSGNWPGVLALLDKPGDDRLRAIALRAAADQYVPALIDGLTERLDTEKDAERRSKYAELLARVYRRPAPWKYWGFRPPPRPTNTVDWERTVAIETVLDRALAGLNGASRAGLLRTMVREQVPIGPARLAGWLRSERDPDSVRVLLNALGGRSADGQRPVLERVVADRNQSTAVRQLAAAQFMLTLDAGSESRLLALAEAVEEGAVLAGLLRALERRPGIAGAAPLLLRRMGSGVAEVRAAALRAAAALGVKEAGPAISRYLDDSDASVRAAAARAAGTLLIRSAIDRLLALGRDPSAEVRRACLDALRQLREPRGLPAALAALGDAQTAVAALDFVAAVGGPTQAAAVADAARRSPSAEVLATAGRALVGWAAREALSQNDRSAIERALADIHGAAGLLLAWQVRGPLDAKTAAHLGEAPAPTSEWRRVLGSGRDARLTLGPPVVEGSAWFAACALAAPEAASVEFLTESTTPITIWLNGRKVYQRDSASAAGALPQRFEGALAAGDNRVVVRLTGTAGVIRFQLGFRRKSSAERERLAKAALSRAGNAERGRQVFLNAEKSLCVKCHRVGDHGERVGPELTGLGDRFARAYIIESILDPSRTIAPSFETIVAVMKNGKDISGVKTAEDATAIRLVDNEARKHVLLRGDIEELRKQAVSTMPEGVEKRLTEDEFVDLIAFLTSLRQPRGH